MSIYRFAELLLHYRTRAGITQQQLADLSTISTRAIRDLERGRAEHPRRDTVRLLADALRIEGRDRATFEDSAKPRAGAGRSCRGAGSGYYTRSEDDGLGTRSHALMGLLDSDMQYEYKTLRLYEEAPREGEECWADALNREAKCGWRLVTVDDSVAFLERSVTDAYSEYGSRF